VIVVLGRPSVYRPEPDGELAPGGLAAAIARALAGAGAAVELAGSIGDDPEGDRVIVELGRAGIGHAAVLRDPAARTPAATPASVASAATGAEAAWSRPVPRLEAADVELALGYLAECDVLVIADPLDPDALAAALRAAEYHGASVVIVADAGSVDPEGLGDRVTLLERPAATSTLAVAADGGDAAAGGVETAAGDVGAADAAAGDTGAADAVAGDAGADAEPAFAGFVAEYALRLDRGEPPARAFAAALGDSAWERAADASDA
jgi:hypothetical protein